MVSYNNFSGLYFDADTGFSMTTENNNLIVKNTVPPSTSTITFDQWTLTNLINSPSIVGYTGGTGASAGYIATSNNSYVAWTYPTQSRVCFINEYLPLIQSFSATWSGKIGGIDYPNSGTNTSIITNGSGNNYVKYPDATSTPSSAYITGIVLTNLSTTSGYRSMEFPDGVTRNCYLYYNSLFSNATNNNDYINLNICYTGYQQQSILTIPCANFLGAGVPSAPTIQNVFYSTVSAGITGFITSSAPTNSDSTNKGSVVPITNYQLNYITGGDSFYRYGGAIAVSQTSATYGNLLTLPLSAMYPDSAYTFTTQAKNSLNISYGALSNIKQEATGPLTAPVLVNGTLESLVKSGSNIFDVPSYTAKIVSSGNQASNVIFEIPITSPWTSIGSIITAIQQTDTRGSTADNLSTVLLSLAATISSSSISVNYNGFGKTQPNITSNDFVGLIPGTTSDYYHSSQSAYQGYYLTVPTQIQMKSSAFLASNTQNVLTFQNNSGGSIASTTFPYYYDNTQSSSPSNFTVSAVLNLSNIYIQISGIYVLKANVALTATTAVSNVGYYFYNNNQIIAYTTGQIESNLSNTNPIVTGSFIPSPVTFTNNTISYSAITNYQTSLPFGATAYTPYNATNNITATPISVIIDKPSWDFINSPTLYKISITDIGTSSTSTTVGCILNSPAAVSIGGYDFLTVIPPYSTYSTLINNKYSNTANLSSTNNLQIFNGKIRTIGSSRTIAPLGYIDYSLYANNTGVDYSGIQGIEGTVNTTEYCRFSTYVWKINNSTGYTQFTNIKLIINGIEGVLANVNDSNGQPTISGEKMYIYYLIDDFDSAIYNGSNINTTWININISGANDLTGSNYYNTSIVPGGKNVGIPNIFTSGTSGTSGTYTLFGKVPTFPSTLGSNVYLYVRLALPVEVNFAYTSVTASLYT
jgi:hypothetical protein